MMRYESIPGIDKPVSRLVQGTIMINSQEFEWGCALLDGVFELGCTTFDTGHIYGKGDNERSVGRWVNERGLREQVVIIGKGAHHTHYALTYNLSTELSTYPQSYPQKINLSTGQCPFAKNKTHYRFTISDTCTCPKDRCKC